jgi:lysophospholipase
MSDFLGAISIEGFDAAQYFDKHSSNTSQLPNVALAFSGGGYRACLNGGGAVKAFDSREADSSIKNGGLGGLLQSATYLAGLSGGGWLVGSIYVNNFTTISDLQNSPNVWGFDQSIFEGPDKGKIQLLDTASYFDTIKDNVDAKNDAGYNTTITDYWGRALSFQLVNATNGGPSVTWSSIRDQDGFSSGDMPYPVVVADARAPNELIISANSSIYEFSPYEFGTWDPTTYGFVDTRFVGTEFNNGSVSSDSKCVRGFDNAGFVMGTSSSLFNQFLLQVNQTSLPDFLTRAFQDVLGKIGENQDDIAAYRPNPFFGYNRTGLSKVSQSEQLTLVDGGSDLQNIPLQPLIQPVRDVDVIFAVDSSADNTFGWPNGTSLVATYERSMGEIANGTSFPSIPDVNTFVNLGLNAQPTFFGCDASNTTTQTPLVVYIPNAPYVFNSNVSTFDPSYTTAERDAIVANGLQVATMGNATVDKQWQTCVGCAVLQRSLNRTNTQYPQACQQCFDRYCWNGTTDSSTPKNYDPTIKLNAIQTEEDAAASVLVSRTMMGLALVAGLWLM